MFRSGDAGELKVKRKLKDKPKNQHLGLLGISTELNLGISTLGDRINTQLLEYIQSKFH